MNFNTEEIKASTPRLKGNLIHVVKFEGAEAVDFKNGEYKCIRFNFANDEGTFSHTEFPLKDGDDRDTEGMYGKQPSRLLVLMTFLRHLGNAVAPSLVAFCNDKAALTNITWEQFRNKVVEACKEGIGKETKIKLMSRIRTDNNTGQQYEEAVFPAYFLNYNRSGELYMSTNFIGNGVYFTNKELTRMKNAEKKPVDMAKTSNTESFDIPATTPKKDDFDIDLENL